MKNSVIIISLMLLFFGCENSEITSEEIGFVEGKVSIGPLCGNIAINGNNSSNPCGLTDEQMNAIYSKYKVGIKGEVKGIMISKEFVLNRTGVFTFEVPVGIYKVEVILPVEANNQSLVLGNSINSVKVVSVIKNQVTKIELSVDTGIK